MRVLKIKKASISVVAVLIFWLASTPAGNAQSTDQFSPTPILTNQVEGEIRARDIGDSRVTKYYYIFTGRRGDVFINIVTRNINGSIDIFTKTGLKPRTKIRLFADSAESETGRVVYMRQAELLILRIQGRTPNDDPGTYQIKFAGSFAPATGIAENGEAPTVDEDTSGSVRVNSVGTIIPDPKPDPTPVAKVAENAAIPGDGNPESVNSIDDDRNVDEKKAETAAKETSDPKDKNQTPVVVVTNPFPETDADKTEAGTKPAETKDVTVNVKKPGSKPSAIVRITRDKSETAVADEVKKPEETKTEPTLEEKLAKVTLQVELKDGAKFSRPMNEVLSVNVIRGVLTIVTTDGRIQEFSILDVIKMSIE
ncbi:MAG: hypothetical protein HKN33_10230 [Pyrinomonadaceae bacterium]|nr:hypothetical protein [Pyrinomonadaceae bacterium]